jgi:hypothetical protein
MRIQRLKSIREIVGQAVFPKEVFHSPKLLDERPNLVDRFCDSTERGWHLSEGMGVWSKNRENAIVETL